MSEEFGSGPGDDVAADEELRALLSGLDPMPARVPVEQVTSPRARHLLEQIMSQSTEHGTEHDTSGGTTSTMPGSNVRPFRSRGKTWLAAAAAVAAVALGTTVAVSMSGGDGESVGVLRAPNVLALTAPAAAGGPAAGMCIQFDVAILAQNPVAFAGTVTSITPQVVTLKVDRWFKGGDADQVTVAAPASDQPNPVLEGGVDYQQGQRYLISATDDGTVTSCGYSGPATPEFEKQYEQAFPAS